MTLYAAIAEQLQSQVEEQFIAATSRRELKIATTDYDALSVLPELAPTLRQDTPYISLSFTEMLNVFQFDDWSEVDLVIAADEAIESPATAEVVEVPLLREDFVKVVGRNKRGCNPTLKACLQKG